MIVGPLIFYLINQIKALSILKKIYIETGAMKPQPKRKADKIIDSLNSLPPDQRHNAFVLGRYKKDAEKLRAVNPGEGFTVLGVIGALEKKPEDMNHYHRLSLEYNKDIYNYMNYAISLGKLSFLSQTVEFAEKAYAIDEGNIGILNDLIHAAMRAGRFSEAKRGLDRWARLNPHENHPLSDIIFSAERIMSEKKVSMSQVEKLIQDVASVARKRNIYIHTFSPSIFEHDGEQWIKYSYECDALPEEILDLEDEIDIQLAELPSNLTEAIEIEYYADDSELDQFIGQIDDCIKDHPESLSVIDKDLLDRISKLVEKG
ncbi:MAG: hypothetical protein PHP23_02010 [Desulfobacterales bacterium]|nr:hypothetical protein [Desulfobacterales bacterium]MDD4070847.1 hypothetical protein [Desulfobacterales bacterium]MDD4391250.1 hypothetical protein [Desulfobacterales bacterium]